MPILTCLTLVRGAPAPGAPVAPVGAGVVGAAPGVVVAAAAAAAVAAVTWEWGKKGEMRTWAGTLGAPSRAPLKIPEFQEDLGAEGTHPPLSPLPVIDSPQLQPQIPLF